MLYVGRWDVGTSERLVFGVEFWTLYGRETFHVGRWDVGRGTWNSARWTLDITLGVVRSAVRMLGRWTFGRVTLDVGRADIGHWDVGTLGRWLLVVGRWTLDVRMFDVGCCTLYDRHVDDDGHPGRVGR